jgi:hypothetical protein
MDEQSCVAMSAEIKHGSGLVVTDFRENKHTAELGIKEIFNPIII